MDKRKTYYIMLDTETCPLDKDYNAVTPYNMFVYDMGFAVIDKQGNIYEAYSFIVADIFFDEKTLMDSAYYKDKLPKYYEDIKSGKRKVATWLTIRKDLAETLKKYNTKTICAHNMRFDYGSTNNTQRWLSKSKYRYFLPYGCEIWDTMKMALDVIAKTPTYKKFCEDNGFLTKHKTPRPQVKAEVLYKYITGNLDFVESHTGLEDVLIEKEILKYCFAKHKKMRKECFS